MSFPSFSSRGPASKKDGLATPCPWADTDEYAAATAYRQQFRARYEREAQALATLTGWNIGDIRRTMNIETASAPIEKKWYQRLWNN
ncbi:MAG: hypothetical protein KGS09_11885 [Nitrospirae bacterium]|nr:hypothetical protein [Nitrospirota bacterium]